MKSYFLHDTAIVDEGAQIGEGTKIWHWTHVSSNAKIGENCNLGQNVYIANNVSLGNNVKVQNNVSVFDNVFLEDDVFCGPSMVFTNVINPRSRVSRKDEYRDTIVRKGSSIGANATIICGCEIGKYSFIGAGSVVSKDTLPYSLNVGVPSRQIGWVTKEGITFSLNEDDKYICKETNTIYFLANGMMMCESIK